MNLKAKRLVRTPNSEQYALFDLDRTDENLDPLSVGKLDLHYTPQGLYGTCLFWEEACRRYSWPDVLKLAEALLAEFHAPMGIPGEYAVELFLPTLKRYELLSNIEPEESAAQEPEPNGVSSDVSEPQEIVAEEPLSWLFPLPGTVPAGQHNTVPAQTQWEEDEDTDEPAGDERFVPRVSKRFRIHSRPEGGEENED